jgi:hypothetical protein
LRWTHKATRNLAAELRRQGFPVSHTTIARLLRQGRYALRSNRKRLARTQDPERDRQFQLIGRQRQWFLRQGFPVLSVDTKKKELVGNFKNAGRCWRRRPLDVLDHDFPSAALGRAIPYGIYDQGRNTGFVVVGTAHETAAFAIAALERWWLENGRWCYPLVDRGRLRRRQRQPLVGLEGRPATLGGRVRGTHHGGPLPARSLEVEPDRASDVQLDQPELGRATIGQLRDRREVH